jgi:hypothetical protein
MLALNMLEAAQGLLIHSVAEAEAAVSTEIRKMRTALSIQSSCRYTLLF